MPGQMPRAPGKKENYNLDYSRWDCLDDDAAAKAPSAPEREAAREVSSRDEDLEDMLGHMPPELREAARLLNLARENNDPAAERRANELVMQAMKKGTPEMQREFLQQVSKTSPDAAEVLAPEFGLVDPASQEVGSKIDRLRKEMESGAAATRKQLESLNEQQEKLERLRSPEDILKFMHQEGMSDNDLRQIFSGDDRHMEKCIGGMLDRCAKEAADVRIGDPEKAVKAAEALHASVCGDGSPPELASGPQVGATSSAAAGPPASAPAPVEEVAIPDYRLQYHKDDRGAYIAIELTCSLPGVLDMSAIGLDVSEKHVRLSTLAPAPRFAVNAGPFPVLIEPSEARAKYSKKRQELSLTVPAKAVR